MVAERWVNQKGGVRKNEWAKGRTLGPKKGVSERERHKE